MKSALFLALAFLLAAPLAQAQQGRMWRCAGNMYTNDAALAQAQNCKTFDGGSVTVVEGTRVNSQATVRVAAVPSASAAAQPGQKVDSAEQKARDADARLILEAELKKAQARQAELAREWNNGEPEKLGPEHRNHQKYLDRVAELKASIARNDSDIAGIRRELGRLSAAAATASK